MVNDQGFDGPVVVGVDGSEASEQALVWGSEFAAGTDNELVVVLARSHHVSVPTPAPVPVWPWPVVNVPDPDETRHAGALLADVVDATIPEEIKIEPRTVIAEGSASQAILDVARKEEASLVVTGRRGLGGFKRLMLGSVSDEVASYSPCSVVVLGDRIDWIPDQTVVVGIDGSEHADRALNWAAAHAKRTGQRLHVIYAWDLPEVPAGSLAGTLPWLADDGAQLKKIAESTVTEALQRCLPDGQDSELSITTEAMRGYPSAVLTEVAKLQRASLLVVGTRGRGGFASMVLGSVAHQCLHHAGCPVAVIRSADAAAER